MSTYTVVLGGGAGTRMGAEINKVFLPLRGIPAIVRAIAPFTALCDGVVVVARAEDMELMQTTLRRYGLGKAVLRVVAGGADRQASVANGLAALPEDAQIVLIHDGARALVSETVILQALEATRKHGSGVASIAVTDTVKRADAHGLVLETLDRSSLRAMQTPQAFRVTDIRLAHQQAARDGFIATDDAALLEHAGLPVYLSEGSRENIKLTTAFDVLVAEAILDARDREAGA